MVLSTCDDIVYQSEEGPCLPLLGSLTTPSSPVTMLFQEKTLAVQNDTVNGSSFKKTHNMAAKESARKQSRRESDDLDLTGSPLRCDFDVNEKFDLSDVTEEAVLVKASGPTYLPLSVSDGRRLVSQYNVSKVVKPGPVWALCDAKDKTRTLYLGSHKSETHTKLSKVTWSGPEEPRDCAQKLQNIRKQHQAPLSGQTQKQMSSCCASYCMTGEEGGSSVSISSSWGRAGALLESPPLDAVTHLEVKLVPGDDKTSTSQLWEQLRLLRGFVAGLSNQGVTWVSRSSNVSLLEQVEDLMEVVRSAGPRSGTTILAQTEATVCQNDRDDDTFEGFTLETRQEVDFTDQLWLVLSRAESYAELTEAFTAVFQSIVQDEIRPFIYARNKTQMVRLVQGLLRGGDTIPDLSGSLPLELLVECGVEKLRRDYSHTLLAGELANKEAVAHFMDAEVEDPVEQLKVAVEQLTQLHLVVELAAMAQTFLCLPPDSLRTVVQTALADLRSSPVEHSECTQFRFPIQTCNVKEQLEKVKPHQWQVRLKSVTSMLEVETVVHLQTDRPEELGPLPEPEPLSIGDEERRDLPYYTATLTTLTSPV